MRDIVVCLFDTTGVMGGIWADHGFRVMNLDIQNDQEFRVPGKGEAVRIKADLLHGVPEQLRGLAAQNRIAFVAAFPPCTHLAVSGARWFKGKGLRALADSIHMFATAAEFCEASGAPYLIENPVSTISTYWRKPDQEFHPWHFNALDKESSYTKKTCLWTGGGFIMPAPHVDASLPVDNKRIHYMGGGSGDRRSATPRGFAQAVFYANR